MKKIFCLLMSVCMMFGMVVSVNAITNEEEVSVNSYTATTFHVATGQVTEEVYDFTEQIATNRAREWSNRNTPVVRQSNDTGISVASDISGIIEGDDRVRVTNTEEYPYNTICYMEFDLNNESWTGTAFMISKNIAVTAGHNVYENGNWAQNIKLWPGKDGYGIWNNPYGTVESMTLIAPTYYLGEPSDCDWALLVLNENIGERCGWMGFTYNHGNLPATMTISGYPGDHQYYQYKATDTVFDIEGNFLNHRIDAEKGQSGAPIYDSNGYVHGIHVLSTTGMVNKGIQITEGIYNYFTGYINHYD